MSDLLARAEALRTLILSGSTIAFPSTLTEVVESCCTELICAGEADVAAEVAREAISRLAANDPRWVIRMKILLLRALSAVGAPQEVCDLATGCLAAHRETFATEPLLRAHVGIWHAAGSWQLNRARESLVVLSRIRSELLLHPDSSVLGWCSYQLTAACLAEGDRNEARRFALEALVSARRAEDSYLEGVSLIVLGIIETSQARWSVANETFMSAQEICEKRGFGLVKAYAMRDAAILMWKRGALDKASKLADAFSAAVPARGHRSLPTYAALLKGLISCHSGHFGDASSLIHACERRGDLPQSRAALLTTEYLGDILLEQGQAEAALKYYEEVWPKAIALVPKGDIVAELRRRIAECHYLLGRFVEAHKEALDGLDHCRELGDRYEEAATYRVLALSTAAIGKPSDAKKWFDQGFAYYDDIETPYEWGKLWMAYGDWLRGPHAGDFAHEKAALEAYQAAADHFERMGAQAKLAEAQARIAAMSPAPASAEKPATKSRRPARKPRGSAELERRSTWAHESFGFITRNPAVLSLLEDVAKLAKSDSPILVLGESGTGKELVANGVHRLSGRTGLFVPINCGAIPRDMIESELFGHVAGAFTGATRDKPGILETCEGGTVFLDEIGEMPPDLQARLLRFLERNEARRVGSNRNYSVDTRVVAATNRERGGLERGEGFRTDLYYRLAHAVITLPPLRRRGDDIELLIDHFMAEFSQAEGKAIELTEPARERLLKHSWPGNVRQLRAILRRLVLLGNPGHVVEANHLQLDEASAPVTLLEEMELAEKTRIIEALAAARGSRTEAAKALGMPRTTLINKLQRYRLK